MKCGIRQDTTRKYFYMIVYLWINNNGELDIFNNKKNEKSMLPRYYQLAREELGIQEVYNENENMFNFINVINRRIDRIDNSIDVNGNKIAISDYKIYLNNKILREEKFNSHDNKFVINMYIPFWVSIMLFFAKELLEDKVDKTKILIVVVVIITIAAIILISKNLRVTKKYANNIGFYSLLLEILN